MKLDIVSPEELIFSGEVTHVFASGEMGELEVCPGHTPLMTPLNAGSIRYTTKGADTEELLYICGGVLEVQPYHTTVLADTAIRAKDLDEATAQQAIETARTKLAEQKDEVDYSQALAELSQAAAQIRLIKMLKNKK
ncbi:MAG TPA: F0F1 ATP synthase subunit epsilon [Gammaproteobacteria bacterium]|nr:F0F1 ATP synthase subunit epsilon [Gammaproteobacteria bacterium]